MRELSRLSGCSTVRSYWYCRGVHACVDYRKLGVVVMATY